MALTNVELYEALKPTVGEEAARLMAEVFPTAADVARKSDTEAVKAEAREEFAKVRGEMAAGFAAARGHTDAQTASLLKWMIAMFIPVWAGTWATVVAIVLKG